MALAVFMWFVCIYVLVKSMQDNNRRFYYGRFWLAVYSLDYFHYVLLLHARRRG